MTDQITEQPGDKKPVTPEPETPEPARPDPQEPAEPETPEPVTPGPALGVAGFVDAETDPQHYVDRYNDEPGYKKWFDDNYPQYDSIYQAVGLDEPPETPADFVEGDVDPYYYVARYNIDHNFKKWFDDNYPQYSSIEQAVEFVDTGVQQKVYGFCGTGTELIDGVCTVVKP